MYDTKAQAHDLRFGVNTPVADHVVAYYHWCASVGAKYAA